MGKYPSPHRASANLQPGFHRNRAVASGAVLFYLDNFVASRLARATYGTTVCTVFDIDDPHHLQRRAGIVLRPVTSEWVLPDLFAPILYKVRI